MVLNVNLFQKDKQKCAFDADFSSSLEGLVWCDHPALDGTTDIKPLLPQWGCTAWTSLVVRLLRYAHSSRVVCPDVQKKLKACTERV